MITEHYLKFLLSQEESEYLDFKETFHDNMVELVHDILCLANAYTPNDRYLIFGVKDKTKEVVGVKNDPNRKAQANIYDTLRQSNFAHLPTIHLNTFTVESGKEIDVLEIINQPNKPFTLTKDKRLGQLVIRAGVIYTRLGDTNIPLKECAADDKVELMWRERFGIGEPPLRRVNRLLDEVDNWVDDKGIYFHHRVFPEFTIEREESSYSEPFFATWCDDKFPNAFCSRGEFLIKYHTTVLERFLLVYCDGGKVTLPSPDMSLEIKSDGSGEFVRYSVSKSSNAYKFCRLITQYDRMSIGVDGDIDSILYRLGVCIVN